LTALEALKDRARIGTIGELEPPRVALRFGLSVCRNLGPRVTGLPLLTAAANKQRDGCKNKLSHCCLSAPRRVRV
jgi:hypothetical protein